MERKFKITVEGRAYNVTVEELTDPNSVHHNPQGAIFVPAAPHAPLGSNHSAGAPVLAAPAPSRVAAEPGDVVSGLGGVVESILVAIGQDVSAGDRVAVIEAMKMKTPVVAHQSGRVAEVLVKVGDGVETGQVLARLA